MNIACSGSSYTTTGYYPGGGGPTVIQDQVPRTAFDVDIYKLKAEQELAVMKMQHDFEIERRKDKWLINKPKIDEKLADISRWIDDVRSLMYL